MKGNITPTGHPLHVSRWCGLGQVYLITTVTKGHEPIFRDFKAARALIGILREEALRNTHQTLAFVVMPDHLHWLMILQGLPLSQLVSRIKSLSARRIGRPIWQAGFHDHAVQREESLVAIARYLITNPLRAGLVKRIGLYPHWDAAWL